MVYANAINKTMTLYVIIKKKDVTLVTHKRLNH